MECGLFDADVEASRARRSAKWCDAGDVIPMWIAEMDTLPAPAVRDVLTDAVLRGDTGYVSSTAPAEAALLSYMSDKWGVSAQLEHVTTFGDVGCAVRSHLASLLPGGGKVVVTPPVYLSFYRWLKADGFEIVEVPLVEPATGGALDLHGLEAAFAAGARVFLLCSPHNPTGAVFDREAMVSVAELADKYGVTVISDEIHAPLTYGGTEFVSYSTVSDSAAATSITVTSPSKGWNIAGLRAAFSISARTELLSTEQREDAHAGTGHFGALAAEAAYSSGREWMQDVAAELDARGTQLGEMLTASMPEVGYVKPRFGYLAWLDCRRIAEKCDGTVQEHFLEHAKVNLLAGEAFSSGGEGFVRLNFGCSRATLEEAVTRLASSL